MATQTVGGGRGVRWVRPGVTERKSRRTEQRICSGTFLGAPGALTRLLVGDEVAVDDVEQPSLQRPDGLLLGLAPASGAVILVVASGEIEADECCPFAMETPSRLAHANLFRHFAAPAGRRFRQTPPVVQKSLCLNVFVPPNWNASRTRLLHASFALNRLSLASAARKP